MSLVYKGGVPLLLAVFVLGDAQIHVHSVNCSNIATDIKTPVN